MKTVTFEQLIVLASDPRTAPARQIMLDLDSTVFPILPAMARHPEGIRCLYEDCMSWGGLVDLVEGETKDERLANMLELFARVWSDEHMPQIKAFAGAADAIRELRRAGIIVHVLTHRPTERRAATAAWLEQEGIEFDHLHVDMDIDKIEFCRKHGILVMVDDHPELIEQAQAAGITPVSLIYPYNERELQAAGQAGARDWRELRQQVASAIHTRAVALIAPTAAQLALRERTAAGAA